jgi:hypothetical protein
LKLVTELGHLYGDEVEESIARDLTLHRFWSLNNTCMLGESLEDTKYRKTWSYTRNACPELYQFMENRNMTGAMTFISYANGLQPITARLFTPNTLLKSLGHVVQVRSVLVNLAKLPPETMIILFLYEVSREYDDRILTTCLEKYRHGLLRCNYSMRVDDLRRMSSNDFVLMFRECEVSAIDAICILNHL